MRKIVEKLSPAQRNSIRRLATPRAADESEAGELNVVPFLDIITNVLMFVLATVALSLGATIDTAPPRRGPGGPSSAPLGLTILIAADGFSVKASGGNVASGCDGVGPGLAVPKKDGAYDYAALHACVAKIKGTSSAFAEQNDVTLSADPAIRYQTVIAVMDAVRKTDDGRDLFADVQFAIGR